MEIDGNILATKIIIPERRPQAIERSRLVDRMDKAADARLTLLSAPAGYGKTTLLSHWAERCSQAVCWYSLDEGDNDTPRFFQHLAASLQKVDPTCGKDLGSLFRQPLSAGGSEAMSLLINDLADVNEDFFLVLDDYHLIHNSDIHSAISLLLAHLPAAVHLVISTRADPPFSLVRLRAGGQLNEIRMADLRFYPEEAAQFLKHCMHLNLTGLEINALERRIEGWPAGFQMAGLSMQGRGDLQAFVNSFTGSNRFILDYLLEEVLSRQTPDVQDFLLQTSILPRLNAGLCDAVCDHEGSQAILELLERSNLFLVALDEGRCWFRYHQLFADLLRQRLLILQPQRIQTLHRLAAAWFEAHELFTEAIQHMIAAQEYHRAAMLLQRQSQNLLINGHVQTLRAWLEEIPKSVLGQYPDLGLLQAWVMLLGGSPIEQVETCLNAVEIGGQETLQSKSNVLYAYMAILKGYPADAGEYAKQALCYLEPEEVFLHDIAVLLVSLSQVMSGHLQSGQQALDELAHLCLRRGNRLMAVITFCNIAEIYIRRAQLSDAMRIYQRAAEIARDEGGRYLPMAGEALIGMGEIMREWNELDQAVALLEEGVELAGRWQQIGMLAGVLSLARIDQARGDSEMAFQRMDKARELALDYEDSTLDDLSVDMFRAQLCLQRGRLLEAREWAQLRGLDGPLDTAELDRQEDFVHYHLRKYEYLVAARLFIFSSKYKQAASLLDALLARMPEQGRTRIYLEALLLKALLLKAHDRLDEAIQHLEEALILAEPAGFVRLFVDEGGSMASLLHEAARRQISPAYTRRLLAAFPAGAVADDSALVEPLTERELEILQLLDGPATNQDIAGQLYISTNTVKKHVAHILAKLSAANRRQAVAIARSMGLVRER